MKRFVTGTVRYCHLCGLTIPSNIVSANHPLFGAVWPVGVVFGTAYVECVL